MTDATALRNSLLRSFEDASAHSGDAPVGGTRIVVVGGGPTGVELSGYGANFLFHHQFVRDYPQLDPQTMQVSLIEHGERPLAGFHPRLSDYALRTLRSRGVDVRLGTDVVEVDRDGVTVSGERIAAATVVWAGGVDAPGWIKTSGLALDRGRVTSAPICDRRAWRTCSSSVTSPPYRPRQGSCGRSSRRSPSSPDATPGGRSAGCSPASHPSRSATSIRG